jgi:hypothetical protein
MIFEDFILGAELVTNGDFSAWTNDNPDGWEVSTENENVYVTQDEDGAKFVSDGGYINLAQNVLTLNHPHLIEVEVSSVTQGKGILYVGAGMDEYLTNSKTYRFIVRPSVFSLNIKRGDYLNPSVFVIKRVSCRKIIG